MPVTTVLLSAATLMIVGAGAVTHVGDVTGRWREHGKPGNFMTVASDQLIITEKLVPTLVDVEVTGENPGEVAFVATIGGEKHQVRIRPKGANHATFTFDGDASEMDRMAPIGQGAGDKLSGKWYMQLPDVPLDDTLLMEFTPKALVTTEPGKEPQSQPLIVTAETPTSLTVKDEANQIVFTVLGDTLTMKGSADKKAYTFIRK